MEDIGTYIILDIPICPSIEKHLGHFYVTILACKMQGGPSSL